MRNLGLLANNFSIWIPAIKRALAIGCDHEVLKCFRTLYPNAEIATSYSGSFDLVILCHVPLREREATMNRVKVHLSSGGNLVFLDWIKRPNLLIRALLKERADWEACQDVIHRTRELFNSPRLSGHASGLGNRVVLHLHIQNECDS